MMQRKILSGIATAKIIVIILLLLLIGCFPPPRPILVDLTVRNIEITQAIQTPTNTVTLVAQRSTTVRATLGTGGGSAAGVTGRLHVFVNGIENHSTHDINESFETQTNIWRVSALVQHWLVRTGKRECWLRERSR